MLDVGPPVTADGVVYVVYAIPDATHNPRQDTYALAALRAQDGLPLWRIPATQSTRLITAADGVLIVDGLATSHLVGLRASDGATLWRASLPIGPQFGGRSNPSAGGWLVSEASPSGGVLYAMGGSDHAAVFAFQVADGRILWQTDIQRSAVRAPPVVDGANVYVGADDGSVVALRADTGAIRWTAFPGSPASTVEWHAPLGSFGGELYVTEYDVGDMKPAVVRLNVADGANDGVALYLDEGSQALYPTLTADIFTTLGYPNSPSGPTLSGWRLSRASDGFPLPLWSVPEGQFGGEIAPSAHDAQTFYIEFTTPQEGTITAYRLTDGVVLWRRQSLARDTSIVAGSRELFETVSGIDDVCRTPLLHRAPQVRALAAASGAVVWTRALDATR
ncbi:MAG TPA: PQQ-binding-like beta-propeller repeat protein [Ktedonobacterales bacterium]|nr:PQQ-binding-like beta-propeller repeat protein [Ktedonobacterales bacterium]